MESLACKSPSRCRVCEHFDAAAGCALEAAVDDALEALALQARPRIPVRGLVRADARRAASALA